MSCCSAPPNRRFLSCNQLLVGVNRQGGRPVLPTNPWGYTRDQLEERPDDGSFSSRIVRGRNRNIVISGTRYASHTKRALLSSLPQVGSPLGLITANVFFLALVALMPSEAFLAWGWRIPFAFSLALVFLGFYLRRQIDETPEFKTLEGADKRAQAPFLEVLKRPIGFILVAGGTTAMGGTYYIVTTYMLSAVSAQVGVERSTALACLLAAAAVQALCIPLFGWLAGRVNPGFLMLGSVILIGAWAFPLVFLVTSGIPVLIGAGFAVYMVFQAMMYGPMGSAFPALFDTRIRYTGLGMGLNIGGVLGGITPIFAAQLPLGAPLAVLMIALCTFSTVFAVAFVLVSRRRSELGHDEAVERVGVA